MASKQSVGFEAAAIVGTVVVLLFTLASATLVPATPGLPSGHELVRWTAVPHLQPVAQYRYTLTARVKLLLFWITRDDVGAGRIVRSADPDGSAFELLIGSDPDRAPMHVNRWGYIVEVNRQSEGYLVGLMTESDEQTIKQSAAAVQTNTGSQAFKAIRAHVGEGEASAQVLRIAMAGSFTFRDVNTVLQRLPEGGAATAQLRVPAGTRPGFLGAVADLVHLGVEASRQNGARLPRDRDGASRPFVYDRWLYDVRVKGSEVLAGATFGSIACRRCIESEFEVCNRTTGNRTKFSLVYGTEGTLAEVPIRIVYRPRWWFEAALTLEHPPGE